MNGEIALTKEIADAFDEVREGASCNMFERNCVVRELMERDYFVAADWAITNKTTYAELIFGGYYIADLPDVDEGSDPKDYVVLR